MSKLFLDDFRNPPDSSWDTVKSYDEFVAHIEKNGVPDIISFDHDLGKEHYGYYIDYIAQGADSEIPYEEFVEKTGYDCAKWLIERGILPKEYRIHSMNPAEAMNIRFAMEAAYRHYQVKDGYTS